MSVKDFDPSSSGTGWQVIKAAAVKRERTFMIKGRDRGETNCRRLLKRERFG